MPRSVATLPTERGRALAARRVARSGVPAAAESAGKRAARAGRRRRQLGSAGGNLAKERDWFARRRAVSRRGSAVRRPLRPSAARHRIRGPRRGQAHARHGRWPGRVRRQGQVAVVAAGGRDGDGHRQTRSDGRLTAKAGSRPASCGSVDSRGLDEPCRSTARCRARRSRRAPARPGRLRREARGSVGSSPCLRWR